MRNKIQYIITTLLLTLITACDDTEDYMLKANDRPTATFTFLENSVTHLRDSVKFGSQLRYEQPVTVKDLNNNLQGVYFSIESGQGYVLSRGFQRRQLKLSTTGAADGIYDFRYQPQQLGYHEIHILALDRFYEADTLTVSLQVFENLTPVARLKVKPSRVVSRYEYTIDGSESYDRDAKFGGKIERYQFQINSTVIELHEAKFSYVFGGEQIVTISLKVQDSNGTWSELTEGVYSVD